MLRILKLGMIVWMMAFFANTAEAASIFFIPAIGEYGVGKEISVDIKINSEDTSLNATQATIRFPKDILSVKSIDKTGSAFNFWLEEPNFSNEEGVISFIGGTPYGVSGASLEIMHIIFTTKSAGVAPVTITDAAITASDGTGTNVLSKTNNAQFQITTTGTTPALLSVPEPVQIVRTPVVAVGLPDKPTISVPLYPNTTAWYNLSNIFTASWVLPRDIIGVNTAINKQPNFTPGEESEGLFDNKSFTALSDGTWYLHVRFKNNIGWGTTAHYRIAIDTHPPLPFEVTSNDGDATDNPIPEFNFKSGDAVSGLAKYQARIDKENWVIIPLEDFKGTFVFPKLVPGKHHITVQAIDLAGNSIESGIDHETIAITSPTFTFVTDKLFSDEARGLTLRGTSLPGTKILLSIKKAPKFFSVRLSP